MIQFHDGTIRILNGFILELPRFIAYLLSILLAESQRNQLLQLSMWTMKLKLYLIIRYIVPRACNGFLWADVAEGELGEEIEEIVGHEVSVGEFATQEDEAGGYAEEGEDEEEPYILPNNQQKQGISNS